MNIKIEYKKDKIYAEILFEKKGILNRFFDEYELGTSEDTITEELLLAKEEILSPEYEG